MEKTRESLEWEILDLAFRYQDTPLDEVLAIVESAWWKKRPFQVIEGGKQETVFPLDPG